MKILSKLLSEPQLSKSETTFISYSDINSSAFYI